MFCLIGRTHERCTHCCWTGLQPASDFQHGNIFHLPPPPGNVNIPTPICVMYHKKLPDFACRQWHNLFGVAREAVARFLFWLLKWKCNNSVGVAAISLPCHKLLWIHTSSPLSGSSIRADSVTFDYSLEGTEQCDNSLISNRWLRSSKGLICTSSCSSVCRGLRTDQRQTGALTVRSTWTSRLSRVSTGSCHVFASQAARSACWSGEAIVIWSQMPLVKGWWKYRSSDTASHMITKARILFILTCFNTWLLFFPPASYACLHRQQWFTAVNWQPVSLGFTSLSSSAQPPPLALT